MNLYDIIFIIQFIIVIFITLFKVFNVMSYETTKKLNEQDTNDDYPLFYDIRVSWILFMLFFITWVLGLFVFMLDPTELIYMTLFKFETLFVLMNVILLLIELFLNLSGKYSKNKGIIQPYYANKNL
jgi:hypothetical protein